MTAEPNARRALWLGLDTGGTYTDAVVLAPSGAVAATAKVLTTRHDLALGIGAAIRAVVAALPAGGSVADIELVSVSTTLATNAVVENQRRPVCALLVGYEPSMLMRPELRAVLADGYMVTIAGGHDAGGAEAAPLDLDAARDAVLAHVDRVEAFAVSSLFSVRNPAHELRVRALVREFTGKPVTCGHELTSRLDAVRRAVTVALNAQLTPQLRHLVDAVQAVLAATGIAAPLMMVKGDGSLMAVEVAVECPVETILSGPAASVVGARFLTAMDDFVVSDMGGTTTDIAIVRGGHPVLNEAGAEVGGWNTMVEAIDVRTFGLGGDSEVTLEGPATPRIGPRRVVPLSLLAATWPDAMAALRRQDGAETPPPHAGRFAFRSAAAGEPVLRGRTEERLWQALGPEPRPLDRVLWSPLAESALRALVGRGLAILSGLTPSDAMHILGEQGDWDAAAARLGAGLALRAARRWQPPATGDEIVAFAREIREQVIRRTGRALCETAFAEGRETRAMTGDWGKLGDALVDAAVSGRSVSAVIASPLRLQLPLVAIGAPVRGYYADVAERLGARLVIPDHASVTNAIGAVAGVVVQTASVLVALAGSDIYHLHAPDGPLSFHDPEAAIAEARLLSRRIALDAARRAGAADPGVETVVRLNGVKRPGLPDMIVEANVVSTATGRPVAAQR